MKLKRLTIELETYGPATGTYTGRLAFRNRHETDVEMPLDDLMSKRILAICAEEMVNSANQLATFMTAELIESINETPALEGSGKSEGQEIGS